jgi:hypothetical protein
MTAPLERQSDAESEPTSHPVEESRPGVTLEESQPEPEPKPEPGPAPPPVAPAPDLEDVEDLMFVDADLEAGLIDTEVIDTDVIDTDGDQPPSDQPPSR